MLNQEVGNKMQNFCSDEEEEEWQWFTR